MHTNKASGLSKLLTEFELYYCLHLGLTLFEIIDRVIVMFIDSSTLIQVHVFKYTYSSTRMIFE